jgi:hypothetical protein
MSRSNKNKQAWSVPSRFKRSQGRKTKMQLKENTRQILASPNGVAELRLRKDHRWKYF